MDIVFDDIVNLLATGLIPMLRISAMIIAAPLISLDVVSLPIRIVLAIVLTWVIYPLIEVPNLNPLSPEGMVILVREMFVGIAIAVTLQVVNGALILAGQALSMSMGLGMAQIMDPSAGTVPVLSSFLIIFSTLIFMSFGGHSLLFFLILQSFEFVPIGAAFDLDAVILKVMAWTSMVFLGGILIAMPIMLTMLLVNLCLGIVTRSAPALNIFAVGFPAMILAGLALLIISLTNIAHRIEWLWVEAFTTARDIWVGV